MIDHTDCMTRILIVEDDTGVREILGELLKSGQTIVNLVADGEQAVIHLQNHHYDLIITDLGLPGISGWDVADAARRYQGDLKMIVITSWRGKDVEERINRSNLDAVIWKPFRIKHIKEIIDRLVPGLPLN